MSGSDFLYKLYDKLKLEQINISFVLFFSGVWNLSVLYDGEHISGSPYSVVVYDPASVRVYGLEGGIVGSDLTFHGKHLMIVYSDCPLYPNS